MGTLVLSGLACTTPEPKNSQSSVDDSAIQDDELSLSHPEKADAWSTHKLIVENKQPRQGEIDECEARVTKTSASARNDQDLLAAKSHLGKAVSQGVALYHWCFYQTVRTLDQKLADSEFSLDQKGEEFFQKMKGLWLLAKALELATGDQHYFIYLRDRYIQLNRDIFGRSMESMAPPIDDRIQAPISTERDDDDLNLEAE